jgi:hypothetical protein
MYLLDTNHDYDTAAGELGVDGGDVGQLLTPLTRYSNRGRAKFAIDNGAYAGFPADAFRSLLRRELPNRERCLFVACPDVVGSARRTAEVYRHWAPQLRADKWPVALVAQDGLEDLDIPWCELKAVFIGGSTTWKCGPHAEAVIRAAQAMGKWTHVGRVNTPERVQRFVDMGVDSVDGSGISQYSHMRRKIAAGLDQPRLAFAKETA